MSYASIINALDMLVEYPDLQEYIKNFDAPRGFMFTCETDPQRVACAARLEQLLDADGNHSGGSWGCLMRGLQAVFIGAVTREEVEKQVAAEKRRIQEYEAAYQLRQAAAAQVRAEYPCQAEADQAEADQAEADQAEAARVIWRDQPKEEERTAREMNKYLLNKYNIIIE